MPTAPDLEAETVEESQAGRTALRLTELSCCAFLLAVAALGLLGGLSGQRVLDSPVLAHVPMAPSTAVLFLVLGGLLCQRLVSDPGPAWCRVGGGLCLFAAAAAFLNGASVLLGQGTGPLDLPFQALSRWAGVPHVNMSPATAMLFVFSGASAWPLVQRCGGDLAVRGQRAAGVLAAVVALCGAVFVLGYVFGSPLLYNSGVVPMARSTALAFLLLGVALVCEAGTESLPLRMFTGPSPQANLMRAFVPLVAALSLAHSLLWSLGGARFGESNALRVAASAMATAVAVGLAVTLVARRVGASLQRAEHRRIEAERCMRLALDEKTVMLKELHHRVKNNMQIVSSLFVLQAEYVADPRDRALFEDTQARIRSMALVHEDLYKSDDLSFVDMGSYVPRLVEQLLGGSSPPVRMVFEVHDVRLPITQSIPCGMLLNELVMNAMKHAFPGTAAPELCVALRREGNEVVLEVEDNGPGLPPGFSLAGHSSFGMVLIGSLTDQLRGTLAAEQREGGGARFVERFPLEEA